MTINPKFAVILLATLVSWSPIIAIIYFIK